MKKPTKSDYDKSLGSRKFTGEITRCFDQDGKKVHCALAKKFLYWQKRENKDGYFPRDLPKDFPYFKE